MSLAFTRTTSTAFLPSPRPAIPTDLLERLRAIECRPQPTGPMDMDLGWGGMGGVEAVHAPLRIGCIHEWFAAATPESAPPPYPMALLIHAARRAAHPRSGWLIWIGAACHAHAAVAHDLLERSIWIDPPDQNSRFWAIDVALRCKSVAAVIADGRALDMAGSRRLQLAAEAGRTVGLIARPAPEQRILSAATTRWLAAPLPTNGRNPRWTVDLLRCKGVRPIGESARRFTVEWDHATQSAVAVSAALGGGTDQETRSRLGHLCRAG